MTGSQREHNPPHQALSGPASGTVDGKMCPQCSQPVGAAPPNAPAVRFCQYCMLPLIEVAGKYQIEAKIDEGGGGAVFLARHLYLKLNPLRVVKFLHNEQLQSPTGLKRFAREIEMTAVLSQNNQHIVRVYDDFGHIPQLGYFYVMEFLEGSTLKDVIRRHPRGLPQQDAIHIFQQLCRAVQTIHQAKIIHRDLKPQNIFLIQRDNDPYFVKVMDFGIARMMASPGITHTKESSIGTPQYMSPEQCMGLPADERSDVYAMGFLLYELLTGRTPFFMVTENSTTSLMEIVSAHLYHEPAPFQVSNPGLSYPQALEDAVLKALSKPREGRFQTAQAFLQAVISAFSQPTSSLPDIPAQPAAKVSPPAPEHPTHGPSPQEVQPQKPHLPTPARPFESPTLSPLGYASHASAHAKNHKLPKKPRTPLSMGAIKWIMSLGTVLAVVSIFVAWKTQREKSQRARPLKIVPLQPSVPDAQHSQPKPTVLAKQAPAPKPDKRQGSTPPPTRRRRQPVYRPVPRPSRQPRRVRSITRPRPRTPGCPPDPQAGRWLLLKLQPKQARVVTKGRIEYRRHGLCVLQRRGMALHLRITHYNFQPCSFERQFKRRTLSIKLKQNQLNIDDKFDYCLR